MGRFFNIMKISSGLFGRAPQKARPRRLLSIEALESRLNPVSASFQVTNLYQSFLNRTPEAGGLAAWTGALETGRLTLGQVAEEILESVEHSGQIVTSCYEDFLGRTPDPAGFAAHAGALERGVPETRVIASILGSSEYFARQGGNNTQFVNSLYTSILGRPADASGLQAHLGRLAKGASRAEVAEGFLRSQEQGRNLTRFGYQELLGREATLAEQNAWAFVATGNGDGTTTLLSAIAGSVEGNAHLGITDPKPGAVRKVELRQVDQDTYIVSWLEPTVGGGNSSVRSAGIQSGSTTRHKGATSYTVTVENGTTSNTYPVTNSTWMSIRGLESVGGSTVTVTAHNNSGSGPAIRAVTVDVPPDSASVWDLKKSYIPKEETDAGGRPVIPAGSPWGNRIGFPGIPYTTIMASAPDYQPEVPCLELPIDVSADPDTNGISISMWVQATAPGMLFAAEPNGGGPSIPYLWIDDDGKVNGGLYGPGPITPATNGSFTLLTSTGAAGGNIMGSPLAITSQTSVVDNNWHHIVLAANSTGQRLYVDGMLQGISGANYTQNFTNQSTQTSAASPGTYTITMDLAKVPLEGTQFDAIVYQGTPESGSQSQQANATYTLSGIVPSGKNSATTNLTLSVASTGITGGGIGPNNTSIIYTKVISATLEGSTLKLTMSGAVSPGYDMGLISVSTSYQIQDGALAFSPVVQQAGAPTTIDLTGAIVTMGGTSNPSAVTGPLSYPQPLTGAVDELAFWRGTMISQSDAQQLMTHPLSSAVNGTIFPNGYQATGVPAPTVYLDFNSFNGTSFTSQSPATANGVAAVPSGLTTEIGTTIPTAPFGNIERLGRYVNYGIGTMTPLASGEIPAPDTGNGSAVTRQYQAALYQGDVLTITRPAGNEGNIKISVTNDLGQKLYLSNLHGGIAETTFQEIPNGGSLNLNVPRTGTYLLAFEYEADATSTSLSYSNTPGSQNTYQVLTNTFQSYVNNNISIYPAYSDPSLPGTLSGNSGYAQGPGDYFPLWSDSNWFYQGFAPGDLATAYSTLVNPNNTLPELDFANLIGAELEGASSPWNIAGWLQTQLSQRYYNAYGKAPEPEEEFFPRPGFPGYTVPATAQEAVYQFLYNTNLARSKISTTLNVLYTALAATAAQSSFTPAGAIANTISGNQEAFITGQSVNIPLKSTTANMGHVAKEAAVSTAVMGAGDIGGLGGNFAAEMILGYMKLQQPQNNPQSSVFVSFVPVMQSMLNYQDLTTLGDNIDTGIVKFLDQITTAMSSQEYLTSIFSNFGLVEAFSSMSLTIQNKNLDKSLNTAVSALASQQAWMTMVPATFTWEAVLPSDFPSGNITNGNFNWSSTQPDTTNEDAYQSNWMTTGDFNNDNFPDLALSNGPAGTVSILLAQPDYSSGTAPFSANGYGYTRGWNYSDSSSFGSTTSTNYSNLKGIVSADFNLDGYADILFGSGSNVAGIGFGGGTGTIANYQSMNLAGGKLPEQVVVADFNNDKLPDFAMACGGSNTVVVGINTTQVSGVTSPPTNFNALSSSTNSMSFTVGKTTFTAGFTTYNIDLDVSDTDGENASFIAAGDFNNDGYTDLGIGFGNSGTGGSQGFSILENQGDTEGVWTGFESGGFQGAQNIPANVTVQYVGSDGAPYDVDYQPYVSGLTAGDFDGDGNTDDLAIGFSTSWDMIYGNPGISDLQWGLSVVTDVGSANNWGPPIVLPPLVYSNSSPDAAGMWLTTVPSSLLENPGLNGTQPVSSADGLVYSQGQQITLVYNLANPGSPDGPTFTTISGASLSGSSFIYGQVVVDPSGMISAVENGQQKKNTTTVGWSNNMVTNNPLATFVPGGQQGQPGNESLPGLLEAIIALQGGGVVTMPVSANGLGTQVASPGFFLAATSAAITDNSEVAISTGDLIVGWQLEDAMGNPIAINTLMQLFGAPGSPDQGPILPSLWEPGSVVPKNPLQPLTAFNNGWYLDSAVVGTAAATWAEAFFGWGSNVPGYSPRNLLPSLSSGEIAVPAGVPYSTAGASWSGGGSLTVSAAQGSPPGIAVTSPPTHLVASAIGNGEMTLSWQAPKVSYQSTTVEDYLVRMYQGTYHQEMTTKGQSVTFQGLDQANPVFFTVQPITKLGNGQSASLLLGSGPSYSPINTDHLGVGIVTDGTPFAGGGFDGKGNAYSAEALNAAGIGSFQGTTFQFGSANQPNFMRAAGQTLDAPTGFAGNLVTIAGAAVNGVQSVQFKLNFTDGTSSLTPTQNISDWTKSSQFPNESVLSTQKYMDQAAGSRQTVNNNLYGYAFQLPQGKTLKSITLPSAANLNIMDIQFGTVSSVAQDLSPYFGQYGIASQSSQLPNGKGFNSTGQYYASEELGTGASMGLFNYTYGPAQSGNKGGNNFVQSSGQVIDLPANTIQVGLAGAVWGVIGGTNQQALSGTVTLNFTDGTSQSFNDTFGSWSSKGVGTGTLISTQNYYYLQDGGKGLTNTYAYQYVYTVPYGKTLKSITLPDISTQFGLLAMSVLVSGT